MIKMIKRKKEAERHFADALRAKTFSPKVETSLTRINRQKRLNQFGWGIVLIAIASIPLLALIECLRVVV